MDYTIASIPLKIMDPEIDGICELRTDPHMRTFDNRKYDALTTGDYYVWLFEERHIEIQGRFVACNSGRAACVCGIIIRDGNNVIRVDRCNQESIQVYRLLKDENTFNSIQIIPVDQRQNYQVRMPSGVVIETHRHSKYIMTCNIRGHSSLANQKTEGLCGNFNGDPTDDLKIRDTDEIDTGSRPRKFKDSFRIPKSESYFEEVPNCIELDTSSMQRCICEHENQVICPASHGNAIEPLVPGTIKICEGATAIRLRGLHHRPTPFRSNTDDSWVDPSDVYKKMEFDPDFGANLTLTWPTPSGKTQEEVETYCRKEIEKSPIAEYCKESTSPDALEGLIEDCVMDVQIADDLESAAGIATVMEGSCMDLLLATRNVSQSDLVYDNETDTMITPEFKAIVEQTCPNLCSDQGECHDGSCVCYEGFAETDCSVDTTKPPEIHESQGHGFCDLTVRACQQTRLYVSNVLSGPLLTCKITFNELDKMVSKQESNIIMEKPARYISRGEVSCDLPESPIHLSPAAAAAAAAAELQVADDMDIAVHTWRLTLTNDLIQYSEDFTYTVYDSTCHHCDVNSNCTQKNATCDISRTCFLNHELDPINVCQQCISTMDARRWSPLQDNLPPELITDPDFYKVSGEELAIQLDAKDPEDHLIAFYLVRGNGVNLTADGYLVWYADHNDNQDVLVETRDQCNASSEHDVRLRIVVNESTTELPKSTGVSDDGKDYVSTESTEASSAPDDGEKYVSTVSTEESSDWDDLWKILTIALGSALAVTVIILITVFCCYCQDRNRVSALQHATEIVDDVDQNIEKNPLP